MIDQLFNSSTIPLLAKVAAFAERRHEALAGNIANISTPDYRTRDLPIADFRAALEEAIAHSRPAAGGESKAWSYTAAAAADTNTDFFPRTLFRAVEAPHDELTFQDGNNRSIEKEVMEMTKNSLMQNVAIELMNSQLGRLQAVISERA